MEKRNTTYLAVLLLIGVLFLVVSILRPYLLAILSSVVLTIIFHPLYEMLSKKIGSRFAAGVTTTIALLFVLVPMLVLFQVLFVEVNKMSTELPLHDVLGQAQPYLESMGYTIDIEKIVATFVVFVSDQLNSIVSSISTVFLSIFVTFYLFFFMLTESQPVIERMVELLPLSKKNRIFLTNRFHEVTYGVVYGQVLTAVIQGLVSMIGYFVVGLEAPVFLGFLTMLFAFIPVMGTGIIWLPASIVLFVQGETVSAIFLFVYGSLVVGLIDNFLRPILIGKRANLHPAFVLLGVVGGLSAFGFVGLFIGPLLLVFARQVIYMLVLGRAYETSNKTSNKTNKKTNKKK